MYCRQEHETEDLANARNGLEHIEGIGIMVLGRRDHGHEALEEALAIAAAASVPAVLIAHTIKGKGVSFMEDSLAWHYRSASPEQLLAAIAEVEAG